MPDDTFDGVFHHVNAQWDGLLGSKPEPKQGGDTGFLSYMRSQQNAPTWEPIADKVAGEYGVPPDVAKAVVIAESDGDPSFKTAGGKVVGLAGEPRDRFLPGEDPSDPETNLRRAFSRLAYEYGQTGDWDRAVTKRFGASDGQGNPTYLGGPSDGFQYLKRFQAARRRYSGG